MPNLQLLVALIVLWFGLPLQAASPSPPGAAQASQVATVGAAALATTAVLAGAPAAAEPAPADPTDGLLRYFNRDVITFRGPLYGVSARDRARRAQQRLAQQLATAGPHKVSQRREARGIMMQIDGETSFWVIADDANALAGESLETLANTTQQALERVIAESRESRDFDAITQAVLRSALASAAALALAWLLRWVHRRLSRALLGVMQVRARHIEVAGVRLLQRERGVALLQSATLQLFRLLIFVLVYQWLSFVLASFPFTRAWGELLSGFLLGTVADLGSSVLHAIPDLVTALLIFLIARSATRATDRFFIRVQSGQARVDWLDAEVAEPTRRIVKVLLWLFALAMAYPYLPGSHTQAFQGLSVLVGLMISLGASNLVGQGASGLILIYGRVFRKGEFVRIGDSEGTVTELGMFATRIRTGLGEELTISNSAVLGATTRNYSRSVKGAGFVLDTTVTIGYDTPWRQVHALLIEAAQRTEGVLAEPAPQVFQTALSDWYPQYRLVCQAVPSEPRPRALVLSALHAHIQDVFNEYGVQIMSPNYLADPASPKVVPPDQWHLAPAMPPADGALAPHGANAPPSSDAGRPV